MVVSIGAGPLRFTDKKIKEYLDLNVANYPESEHAKKQLVEFLQKKIQTKK